jgi:hypothetical protein
MKTKNILAAVTLAGLSVACSQFGHGFGTGHCASGQCKVTVTLAADCRIGVDPEVLDVPAGDFMHIHWKIASSSAPATFDVNGISFPPGQNPDGLFDEKELQLNGKQFHWRDRNTQAGQFKYAINLRDEQGRLCHLDPFIHNQ